MTSIQDTYSISKRTLVTALSLGIVTAAFAVGGCAFDGTKKAKEALKKYGTIKAEWQIRDDEEETTFSYVLLRTKANTHETYEIIAEDGRRQTQREMVGGIDGTGCYITEYGMTSRWVSELPSDALEETRKSGDKTRTKCLEYKDSPAWAYVPVEERKAAEPPPPPPKTPKTPSPDAGSPDPGTSSPATTGGDDADAGGIESALPL